MLRNQLHKNCLNTYLNIKNILLRSNSSIRLKKLINKHKNEKFKHINSTIAGVEIDINTIDNLLVCKYLNGIVYFMVNVAKLSKRKMYGRCSFNLLQNKVPLMKKNSINNYWEEP